MPFQRPSLADLDTRLVADIESRLAGTDPRLRRSFLGAQARAQAGAHHELYGFLAWIALQAFPDTAEAAELARWASIWGVERVAATAATGSLALTGTTGTVVPAGTVWRSGAGQDYASTAEVTLAAGAAFAAVRAAAAGAAGNAALGAKVRLVSPIAGLVSDAAASTALAGGADEESDGSLRARLLARMREPPRGGTKADYELWGLSGHADVTRAWPRPLAGGLGTVTVYVMTDYATDDGIPDAAVVAAVQAYIDARRPVTADVTVAAPAAVELDFTINSVMPDTAAVRAAIEAEVADLILRQSEPGGTILISHIREAISTAAGEYDHVLVAPAANVQHTAAQIAVMGAITWT